MNKKKTSPILIIHCIIRQIHIFVAAFCCVFLRLKKKSLAAVLRFCFFISFFFGLSIKEEVGSVERLVFEVHVFGMGWKKKKHSVIKQI